ncbi:hypothetical protein [[Mycobacterium] nativiensis]|uniref:Glutamyl-tRNA amidotransferase n=1 Tax=[Mycobacterium] nativiensis TaxID=2855503 RepID=A0ABU5XUA8_9MYCO|nr:hypothetical protein [Mycolicibacter sp. MYC340]MEB3031086.1 hypothetical protein [Mycolicibacter sp. MYC340]
MSEQHDATDSQPATPEGEAPGQPPKGNKEARYRVERNEARIERDALAQRVERMQTNELERIAAESISNPADLLALTDKTLADFLTDDGELDAELVTVAAAELLATRPGLRRGSPAFDPSQGRGGQPPAKPVEPTFADLFKSGSVQPY